MTPAPGTADGAAAPEPHAGYYVASHARPPFVTSMTSGEIEGVFDLAEKVSRKPHGAAAGQVLTGEAAELATLRALRDVVFHFADTWAELMQALPDDYECHMNCGEANAAADLYRALGDDRTALAIIGAHAGHDDEEEREAHGDGDGPYLVEADMTPPHAPLTADAPYRHADYDAGENGGAMTDADFYDVTEAQYRRDMAAEDGDYDQCEPAL